MPTLTLPENPSLENLKKRAKGLLKSICSGQVEFREQVKEFHPRGEGALSDFSLNDAQLVVARAYGFASWPRLKEYVERVADFAWEPPDENRGKTKPQTLFDRFIRLSCLAYDGWWRPGFEENARKMLKEHPEFSRENIYGAAAAGDVEATRSLLASDPEGLNRKGGPFGWEPLLYACYSRLTVSGNSTVEVARLLLEAGADPNAGFLWKGLVPPFTALTGAFGNGEAGSNEPAHEHEYELARLLLEAGADPNDGQTLYNRHFRSDDGHLRLLFEYGLGQDKNGPWLRRFGENMDTPARMLTEELWAAARKNFFERVKLLVTHQVDVNTPGRRDGRTPYEAAMREGNFEIASYLLQHGAKEVAVTTRERFASACISGNRAEARALLRESPDLFEKLGHHGKVELLHRAVEANRPEGVRLLAELGFEISEMTRHDGVGINLAATPLHNAAWMGNLEMVKLLIELGADSTVRDPNYNSTPLGWAAYNHQEHVVEYLSQFGPIFDAVHGDNLERVAELLKENQALARAVDNQGYPLTFYLRSAGKHLQEILRALIASGADLNARGKDGKTVVDYVTSRGNERLAEILRGYGAKSGQELD